MALHPELRVSRCQRCDLDALWIAEQMIHPRSLRAPPPHDDLPDPALSTYVEARSIASGSARAAAALLRLCLQQLVTSLGATSSNLNQAVGKLVAVGLPPRVQQAMDTLRVIGNEAVHPGTIDVNDEPAVAMALFDLVNLVVEQMITRPRAVDELYDRLPASKRAEIDRRDAPREST